MSATRTATITSANSRRRSLTLRDRPAARPNQGLEGEGVAHRPEGTVLPRSTPATLLPIPSGLAPRTDPRPSTTATTIAIDGDGAAITTIPQSPLDSDSVLEQMSDSILFDLNSDPLQDRPNLTEEDEEDAILTGTEQGQPEEEMDMETGPTNNSTQQTPPQNVQERLLHLRKDYKKTAIALTKASSHLAFISKCREREQTPKGLRVNVTCSAFLSDLSTVKQKFTETNKMAEQNYTQHLYEHYQTAEETLKLREAALVDNMTTLIQHSTPAEATTHHTKLQKTKDNIKKLERELARRKQHKLATINTRQPKRLQRQQPRPTQTNHTQQQQERRTPTQRPPVRSNHSPLLRTPMIIPCPIPSLPPLNHTHVLPQPLPSTGSCKRWTLDRGLDRGLDRKLDCGLRVASLREYRMEAGESSVIVISSDTDGSVQRASSVQFTPTKRPHVILTSSSDDDGEHDCSPSLLCSKKRLKFEESSDTDSDGSVVELHYYGNDLELPIFDKMKCGYPVHLLIKTVLSKDLDLRRICKVKPLGVCKNAIFIIDIDEVVYNDIKADDLGSWKSTGTKRTYFRFNQVNALVYAVSGANYKEYFLLNRRYFVHKTYQCFHRIISDIQGKQNTTMCSNFMYGY